MAAPESSFDDLMRKYLRVWIWSIIFGLNTTLVFTTSSSYLGKYNFFNSIVLPSPYVASVLVSLISWFYLLLYLRGSLLPMIYNDSSSSDRSSLSQDISANWTASYHQKLLMFAMTYSILAIFLRVVGFVFTVLFDSLGRLDRF